MNPWRLIVAVGWIAGSCSAYGCHRDLPPVPPIQPDSSVDGGCAFDDKLSAAHLIREPDGSWLSVHCSDGGAP